MSYCVNCGVELMPSEQKCPLCDVAVRNPKNPWHEPVTKPYPKQLEHITSRLNRRYGVSLASMFLVLPATITVASNIIFDHEISWALYVVGACICFFVYFLVPFLYVRPKQFLFVVLDTAVTALYLALVDYLSNGKSWFLGLGLPLCLSAGLMVFLIVLVRKSRKLRGLYKAALSLLFFGFFAMAVETILVTYLNARAFPLWSLLVLLPCAIISLIFLYIGKHENIKDEIIKRLFF